MASYTHCDFPRCREKVPSYTDEERKWGKVEINSENMKERRVELCPEHAEKLMGFLGLEYLREKV